ncbi:murein biosynthesis integral membrane protein MurJ [Roseomonas marmotae]|uniref:Probable lipid II flippase MurJ n=1 Tax=Roseomonas marmotae TaxID=2768161 RepID=A0ABS3KCC7_9PROT|nr:murein biosynthesis integral membrane protein MurJ [Roseomonas marmotae]MBO1075128.1 murein biosynthesis integral membrane protein MurJ [Roseomonas marmotae]QTI79758.1 murein biosynthesis integral membrane protein MurJ [Roseomonas marmotae]
MFRNILTIGGWTFASRILGFVRDVLIAAFLGAGPVADAFFLALRLPNMFRRLFGEGAFNAAFVPAFTAALTLDGPAKARMLAERMSTLMTLWLSLLVVIGMIFMPQLMAVLTPGLVDEPLRFNLVVELSRITFPYLIFICLTALVSGVLNAADKFALAAGAPLLFNLCAIVSLFALSPFVATPAHALAWGTTISGVLQLILVVWACHKVGLGFRLISFPKLTEDTRQVLRRMVPGVLGASVTQLNLAIDMFIASWLPAGAISYLNYADRLAQLPLGVVGAAMSTALLPLLSRQLRAGQALSAHRSMNRGIELSLALTLPAAIALIVAAEPIIAVLFQRGAFTADKVAQTAPALAAYAFGLPAFVLIKSLAPGFFARGDTATPVKIGIATVVLNLCLNLALTPTLHHVGIALSTALSSWANAGLLALVLARRGQWVADRRLRRNAWRLLGAAIAMGAILWALEALIFPASGLWRFVGLGVLVTMGLVSYFGVTVALGAFDPRELLRRRRRKVAA